MGTKKKFTPEELKHLQANPYTLRVTADSISYGSNENVLDLGSTLEMRGKGERASERKLLPL